MELAEYRQAVEARATPLGPAVTTATAAVAAATTPKPKPIIKSKKSVKGALFVKKRRQSDSEEDEKPVDKKQKVAAASLTLLADYGDISDSDWWSYYLHRWNMIGSFEYILNNKKGDREEEDDQTRNVGFFFVMQVVYFYMYNDGKLWECISIFGGKIKDDHPPLKVYLVSFILKCIVHYHD